MIQKLRTLISLTSPPLKLASSGRILSISASLRLSLGCSLTSGCGPGVRTEAAQVPQWFEGDRPWLVLEVKGCGGRWEMEVWMKESSEWEQDLQPRSQSTIFDKCWNTQWKHQFILFENARFFKKNRAGLDIKNYKENWQHRVKKQKGFPGDKWELDT